MELTEARVLALRQALDDSVKIYQDGQNAARRSNGTHVRRPLTVIFRSKSAALLDISNAEPPPGPLHVTIDESMIGDSLSSSPADSVDSGVSASSESSVAANGAESMPGRIRQRSMSECYSYGHAPPLKGILKRRPKMCRSVSESYQEEDEEAAGERQNRIAAARRYTVDDEEDTPDSLAVSEAVSQTSLDADGNERPSKKRVSFNERVQERCFRPNSSILGQRKKNQKKHRKRQNSGDSTTTVSSEDEGAAIYRTLATQPPLPPAVKPRFFVGIVDTEDEDFQPATNTDQLLTTTVTSSRPTLQDMDNTIQDMDETIQDMDENIQDNGAPFDSNNNDSGGGSIDGQDFLTSEEPQPRSTKEPRKDSGLDLEGGDDLPQTEEEGVSEPDSPHPHWVSKNRVLAGKSTQHERKCSGDSGMSDDDVFAIIAEE
uniref:Uncharacterized protein n=1 Tax=Plectus sambesii TaxID=2011161 RepID=A0A914X9C9_9BILA